MNKSLRYFLLLFSIIGICFFLTPVIPSFAYSTEYDTVRDVHTGMGFLTPDSWTDVSFITNADRTGTKNFVSVDFENNTTVNISQPYFFAVYLPNVYIPSISLESFFFDDGGPYVSTLSNLSFVKELSVSSAIVYIFSEFGKTTSVYNEVVVHTSRISFYAYYGDVNTIKAEYYCNLVGTVNTNSTLLGSSQFAFNGYVSEITDYPLYSTFSGFQTDFESVLNSLSLSSIPVNDRYLQGYADGKTVGESIGFQRGVESVNDDILSISSFIPSILGSIWSFFFTFVSFNIPFVNISLLSVLLVICGFALIVVIVRLVL